MLWRLRMFTAALFTILRTRQWSRGKEIQSSPNVTKGSADIRKTNSSLQSTENCPQGLLVLFCSGLAIGDSILLSSLSGIS